MVPHALGIAWFFFLKENKTNGKLLFKHSNFGYLCGSLICQFLTFHPLVHKSFFISHTILFLFHYTDLSVYELSGACKNIWQWVPLSFHNIWQYFIYSLGMVSQNGSMLVNRKIQYSSLTLRLSRFNHNSNILLRNHW